jgi:hypothetical protein
MSTGLHQALMAVTKRTDTFFATEIGDIEVVFHLPPIKKAIQYQRLLDLAQTENLEYLIYEQIFSECSVTDLLVNDGEIPAGIPETISNLILYLSGVDKSSIEYTEGLFEIYRNQINDTILFMKRTICNVFGGYTFEKLDELTYQQLVHNFIQAEKVLLDDDNSGLATPFQFKGPEDNNNKVSDRIQQDRREYETFNRPPNQEELALQRKLREQAIQNAKMREEEYRKEMQNR